MKIFSIATIVVVYSKNVYKIYKAHQCAKCHSSRLRGISSSTSIFNAASSSKHIRYTKDKFDKVEWGKPMLFFAYRIFLFFS